MAFNAVRVGSSLVVGVASGALSGQTQRLALGTTLSVGYDYVAAAAALLIGGALQFLAPATLPNLADGFTDGGLAVLANYTTAGLIKQGTPIMLGYRPSPQMGPPVYQAPYQPAYRMNGALATPAPAGAGVAAPAPALYGGVHRATAGLARGASATIQTLPQHRVS